MRSGFRRIGVVGFGLMGGSLARQLKAQQEPPTIRAWSPNEADLAAGVEVGALDEPVGDADQVHVGCDLLVYATPLNATLALLGDHAENWGAALAVTDVVSLKAPLLDRMRSLGEAHRYVGSHPMAGGEGAGFPASSPALFDGARVWLVASEAPRRLRERVEGFWEGLGSRPTWIDPLRHDETMAWVSHLPQLAANALALALERGGFGHKDLGPGGMDMVRLARSSPEMWGDLLLSAPAVPGTLELLARVIVELEGLIRDGDRSGIAERMNRTRRWSEET